LWLLRPGVPIRSSSTHTANRRPHLSSRGLSPAVTPG
jgi:hypothetical protein